MRKVLAFIYLLIIVVNVLSPKHCHDHETQSNGTKIVIAISDHDETPEDSDDHQPGHICHLGHCSFVLSFQEPLIYKNINFIFTEEMPNFSLFNFKNKLFRPPIV